MALSFRNATESISPYMPGKPIDEVKRELGLEKIIMLASNENPFGCSPLARLAITASATDPHRYPDGNCTELKEKLAPFLGVKLNQLMFGAGSDEIISLIARIYINPGDESIMATPSFSQYELAVKIMDGVVVKVPLKGHRFDIESILSAVNERTKIIWLCNPNNPTGSIITADEQNDLLGAVPENVMVVLDEAYYEYVANRDYPDSVRLIDKYPNIVILRTFSKIYGLASLRIGYAVANEVVIDRLNRVRGPFNVTATAQKAAAASLDDAEFVEMSRRKTIEGKEYFYRKLTDLGLEYIPSEANFVMFNTGMDSAHIFKELLKKGIIVRTCDIFGMDTWLRVTVGTSEENETFLSEFKKVIGR